jgi:TolA-binding protein
MRSAFRGLLAVCASLASATLMTSQPVWGQSGTAQSASLAKQAELDAKIQALSASLEQMRAELSQSRDEIKELRSMLVEVMQKMGANASGEPVTEAPNPTSANENSANQAATEQETAHITPDDWQIVNARIEEQAQDKVESNLKYRVKLSGIVLLNAFSVSGKVDNLDVPTVALPHEPGDSSGSVGA